MNNNYYNKSLKGFARSMRNESTKAEVRIWCELLRTKKMMGYGFLRQRPVGRFIADFMCKELKLIIEVDGITHEGREEKDAQRDKELAELGFIVLRFTDEEVMNDLNYVEDSIKEWIAGRV